VSALLRVRSIACRSVIGLRNLQPIHHCGEVQVVAWASARARPKPFAQTDPHRHAVTGPHFILGLARSLPLSSNVEAVEKGRRQSSI